MGTAGTFGIQNQVPVTEKNRMKAIRTPHPLPARKSSAPEILQPSKATPKESFAPSMREGQPEAWQSQKNEVFSVSAHNDLHVKTSDGHFNFVDPKYAKGQHPTINAVHITERGLKNIGQRYDNVLGMPSFLHRVLLFDRTSADFTHLLNHPHLFKYFEDEKFLLLPNAPMDGQREAAVHLKAQKIIGSGIELNAWFMPPQSSSMNARSRQLLHDLAQDSIDRQPLIQELRHEARISAPGPSQKGVADCRTIREMKQDGEYLASLLDLNASHIPLLGNLKAKTLLHLQTHYGVNKHDTVDLYFHFPCGLSTVTLHLHARVNQAIHPYEQAKCYSIDELVSGFEKGKSIEDLILDKGAFPFFDLSLFKDLGGCAIEKAPNPYRLLPESSVRIKVESQDDFKL